MDRDGDKAELYVRKHLDAIGEALREKARLDRPLIPRPFWKTPEVRKLFTESLASDW